MQKKLFILLFIFSLINSNLQNKAEAFNVFGVQERAGCAQTDPFLPTLAICGRSKNVGACSAYTNPCTIADLVETGTRGLVWLISIALLIVPILIMYYGAQMIIEQKLPSGGETLTKIKQNLWSIIMYFILMLSAWLIVRTVVDIFQVRPEVNTFLIDENGNSVKARNFDTNR